MSEIKIGMKVESLSPMQRAHGFRPDVGVVIGGVGIHGAVNSDTGMPGSVTLDLGGGIHTYVPLSWLTPIDEATPAAGKAQP